MQTPMKYALALLAIGGLVAPVALAGHSTDQLGWFAFSGGGVLETVATNACADDGSDVPFDGSGNQGITSTCNKIFADEWTSASGKNYAIVVNGNIVDLTTATGSIGGCSGPTAGDTVDNNLDAIDTAVFAGALPATPYPFPLSSGRSGSNAQAFDETGDFGVFDTNCPDAFSKSASRLGIKVVFYDAAGNAIDRTTYTAKYDKVLGDCFTQVPDGADKMLIYSVRAPLTVTAVQWWSYPTVWFTYFGTGSDCNAEL